MLISCLSNNYFRWAPLYLKSYKKIYGQNNKIWLNGWNLSEVQIQELYSIYKNLTIDNTNIDIENYSKKIGLSVDDFNNKHNQVSEGFRGGTNRHIMNLFAVDLRIEKIYETIFKNLDEEYFLQTDIDLLFRKPFLPIDINEYDIALKLNPDRKNECRKLNIGFIWMKNNDKILKLLKDWYDVLKSVPWNKRDIQNTNNKLWGQYSFYKAFETNKNNLKIYNISSQYLDSKFSNDSKIWSANTRINGSKTGTYQILKKKDR